MAVTLGQSGPDAINNAGIDFGGMNGLGLHDLGKTITRVPQSDQRSQPARQDTQ